MKYLSIIVIFFGFISCTDKSASFQNQSQHYLSKAEAEKKQCKILNDFETCVQVTYNLTSLEACSISFGNRMDILASQRSNLIDSEKKEFMVGYNREFQNCSPLDCKKTVTNGHIKDLKSLVNCK